MQLRYFYETDCFNLNRNARLLYPLQIRLLDFMQNFFPFSFISKAEQLSLEHENTQRILHQIRTVYEKADWEQNLLQASYVVFDTETTGLQPLKGDKIISIAGVIIEKGLIKKDQTFALLVNPLRHIPALSTYITGITNDMVSDKPTFQEILPEFLDFIGDRILVAHNASFDLAFINIALGKLAPIRISNPVIDTYLLATYLLPDMGEHSLESLTKKFGITMRGRHTALGDSLMTAAIFLKLLHKLTEKEIFTLDQLANYLANKKNLRFALDLPELR